MDAAEKKEKMKYDAIIVITAKDFPRLVGLYGRMVDYLPAERVIFISRAGIEEELSRAGLGSSVSFVNESDLLSFDSVKECMTEHLKPLLGNEPVPRAAIGWYYQQFLKMEYAKICEDDYYLAWDGDTIPCAPFSMFQEDTDSPYLDMKREYHALYFETLAKIIPGMKKVIGRSFISEHMLFNKRIMQSLIAKIEENADIPGKYYWEKIIHAIKPERICDSGFSEFETYGTYVALTEPGLYKLRDWHSFRLAGEFFDPETICDRDFEWLAKDFHALSFEKNHRVRNDNKNLFDNPEYQKKMSARRMLEAAQGGFNGGYIEVWGGKNELVGEDPLVTGKCNLEKINAEDEFFIELGNKQLEIGNIDRAYLCYEQAWFISDADSQKKRCREKMASLMSDDRFSLRKVSICIVSHNSRQYMEECIRSIKFTCAPGSYEIVVAENASTDSVRDYLMGISDEITLILLDENIGFPAGCNICISYAAAENDILLLNNDTRLTPNALFWLRYGLYAEEGIGAAGCMGSYAGNHQMIKLPSEEVTAVVDYAVNNNVYMENPLEERSRLCGYAMLIKRSVLEETGLLDEAFSPGYFEDDDLSVRIKEAGYSLVVVHNSFIYHKGSVEFSKRPNDEMDDVKVRNYAYSLQKNGYDIFTAAMITDEELNVLDMIKSGKKKAFSMLEINCGSGNFLSHLKYLFPEANIIGTSPIQSEIDHGVSSIPILLFDPATDDLDAEGERFDYVVVKIPTYGIDYETDPGYVSAAQAKEMFAELVNEGGKLLYLSADKESI